MRLYLQWFEELESVIMKRWWGAAVAAVGVLLAGCGTGNGEVNAGTPVGGASATPASAARESAARESAARESATQESATQESAPPDGAATGRAPSGAADTPRCAATELAVSLGPGDGAAGSVYRPLIFTNTGQRTCELTGFPGVSYVTGDDGHQVGPAAAMSGPRGGAVPMDPGRTSAAELQLVQGRNFDEAGCRPTPVRGLRVYPPGETVARFVPMAGTGCAGDPPGPQLTVKTVTPG